MRIHEVIDEVRRKSIDFTYSARNRGRTADISIYMDYEYYSLCMSEIKGEVSSEVCEFHHKGTIYGYPVYRVVGIHNAESSVIHPPFKVFVNE